MVALYINQVRKTISDASAKKHLGELILSFIRLTCPDRRAVWRQDPNRSPGGPKYTHRMCRPGPGTQPVSLRTTAGQWRRGRGCSRPTAGAGARPSAGAAWCSRQNSQPGGGGETLSQFFPLLYSSSVAKENIQDISFFCCTAKIFGLYFVFQT